jgi:hypothetical protein
MTSSSDWDRYYDMVNRVNRGQANSQISRTGQSGAILYTGKPIPGALTGRGAVNLPGALKKSPVAKKPAPKKTPVAKKPAPKKPTGKKK